MQREAQVCKEFFKDFSTSALGYRLLNVITLRGGAKPIAPEDLYISGLINEIRLMWDHDAYAPIAILEGSESARAGFIAGEFSELLDK